MFNHNFCHLNHIFTKDDGCDGGGATAWLEAAAELSGAEAEATVG